MKNFRPSVIDAASALFEAKPWRMEFASEEQAAITQAFASTIAATYGAPNVDVQLQWGYAPATYTPAIVREDGLGRIESVQSPEIRLSYFSIVNLFKSVRMHVLANGAELVSGDPEAWVHSLFYTIKPAMFRARVREGRISGLTAKDTFTSETWQKLVDNGVADTDFGTILCRPNEVRDILTQIAAGTYVNELPVGARRNDEDEGDLSEFESSFNEALDNDNLPDEFENDEDDEPGVSESFEGTPAEVAAAEADVAMAHEALNSGLNTFSIVQLRRASRGKFGGGYAMDKDTLIAKLVECGVTVEDVR